MIFDIMIVLFVLILDLLSRLIGHRRDVLYYVSKRVRHKEAVLCPPMG